MNVACRCSQVSGESGAGKTETRCGMAQARDLTMQASLL